MDVNGVKLILNQLSAQAAHECVEKFRESNVPLVYQLQAQEYSAALSKIVLNSLVGA